MRVPLLELADVTRQYRTGIPGCSAVVTALAGVSISLASGECLGVAGGAGSGKSTLLLCAAGLLRADSGAVTAERGEYVLLPAGGDGASALEEVLGRARPRDPRVLCIDDAAIARDRGDRERFAKVVRGLTREGLGVLVASRDAEFLERIALRVVTLCGGRVMHTVRRVPALELEVRMTRRVAGRVAERGQEG